MNKLNIEVIKREDKGSLEIMVDFHLDIKKDKQDENFIFILFNYNLVKLQIQVQNGLEYICQNFLIAFNFLE